MCVTLSDNTVYSKKPHSYIDILNLHKLRATCIHFLDECCTDLNITYIVAIRCLLQNSKEKGDLI